MEWSVGGNFIAVARNKVLSILSSKFEEKLSMSLSFKSFVGDSDFRCGMKGMFMQMMVLMTLISK